MTEIMSNGELRRRAAEFIAQRAQSNARAWPRIGKDIALVDEDGPAGSLLFSCRTDNSMSNPLGIVHGGVTASLVDTCMGVTCTAQCGGAPTPTVTMTVNYVRPVPLDADILVRTRTVRVGTTSGQMQAEVFLTGKPEEALATATGVYAIRR
ncbi:MAG: PaaI family thioesterase [Oscillospiraceae bacterium]|nr:PaaI family thioesterase [Oscillospiraceae bacterium]